jgi:hypothetical protein
MAERAQAWLSRTHLFSAQKRQRFAACRTAARAHVKNSLAANLPKEIFSQIISVWCSDAVARFSPGMDVVHCRVGSSHARPQTDVHRAFDK